MYIYCVQLITILYRFYPFCDEFLSQETAARGTTKHTLEIIKEILRNGCQINLSTES